MVELGGRIQRTLNDDHGNDYQSDSDRYRIFAAKIKFKEWLLSSTLGMQWTLAAHTTTDVRLASDKEGVVVGILTVKDKFGVKRP